MKTTPLLGLLIALALAGCGKKTPCSIARAKLATDARAAKATKVTVKPPPAPVARIPLTENEEGDVVKMGDSSIANAAAAISDGLIAEAARVDAFEQALPDRLEAIATGIESSEAKAAKDKLRALLVEDANAKAALSKWLGEERRMNLALKVTHQHLALSKDLSAPVLEQNSKQLARIEALVKQLDNAVNDNAKDEHSFATLKSDLEAVTAACSKK